MNWYAVLPSVLGAVAGSSIVTAIFQVILNHKFSTKLELFKTTLSAELFERQTKFAWLHTERSKALVELYSQLATAGKAFEDMLRPFQTGGAEGRRIRIQEAGDAVTKLFAFCDRHAVFFDADLVAELVKLDDEYRRVWSIYVPNIELVSTGLEWAEAWKKLREDVVPIKVQIEKKVRGMLGVGRMIPVDE
jgi:hypothetical protein